MENIFLVPFPVIVPICIFSALVLIFYGFNYSKSNSKSINLPPGSLGWPIIGETFAFLNDPQAKFVGDRMKTYTPKIFKTHVFGEPTAVFCGVAGNKFIASNEEKLFVSWRPQSTQWLFRGSYQKVASVPTLRAEAVHIKNSPGFLKIEAMVRNIESVDAMVQEHLKLHWDGKTTVEVYHLAQQLVTALSTRFFTGLPHINEDQISKFARLINVITSGLHTFPVNVPGTAFYGAMKAAEAMRKEVMLLVKEKKAIAESNGIKVADIMSHLLFNPDPTGRYIPENEVADKAMGLMVGGFHSPSMATSFLVKFLGERPQVCHQVREEQLEIARSKESGEALNWDDIQKMKYSWGVALEVMRLVPPLQGTFREVITDFTYEGYTVPKGWKVYWSASSTNKDPEHFGAPEEFDPSRFENGKAPPAYSNIPFGSGPRICPGKEYARLQLLCFLHRLVTKYKWEVLNPDAKIAGGLNPVPEEGFHIRLQPLFGGK